MVENPSPNPATVDAAIEGVARPVDTVSISAQEAVRLRERAALADRLGQKLHSSLATSAVADAVGGVQFVSESARLHVQQLMAARVVIKPDHSGDPLAFDRVTGRTAAEVIREALASGEYAHFLVARHQGGGGGGNGPAPEPPGGRRPGEDWKAEPTRRMLVTEGNRHSFGKPFG
jgi:hypothetical protein